MFRSLILLFLTLLLGCGGGGGGGDEASSARQWLVLVYMAGDNNLDTYVSRDLDEMSRVGDYTDAVKVVALVDRIGSGGDGVWESSSSGMVEVQRFEDDLNMGDPNTLVWFVSTYVKKYPAERVALIMWNHGLGWFLGRERARYAAADDTSEDDLELYELKKALDTLNVHFSLIGFDECYMGNLSVIYSVMSWTDNIVFSESEEDVEGWDYYKIFDHLRSQPYVDGEVFGKVIVDTYGNTYKNQNRVLALITAEGAKDLLDKIDELCDYVDTADVDFEAARDQAALAELGVDYSIDEADDFVDLGRLMEGFSVLDEDCEKCREIRDIIASLYVVTTGSADVTGIAAYFPSVYYFDYRYRDSYLNPYAVRRWDDCLVKFYSY